MNKYLTELHLHKKKNLVLVQKYLQRRGLKNIHMFQMILKK